MRYRGVTKQVVPIMPPRHLGLPKPKARLWHLAPARALPTGCGRLFEGAARVCGAPALRRGSSGSTRLCAAWGGAGTHSGGVCARALAARALLRRACGLVMTSAGLGSGFCVGSMRPWKPLRGQYGVGATPASELPYSDRRAPRRFLVLRAARERCGACLGVPAPRRGSSGLGAASDGARQGRRTSGERLACVHWLSRLACCCCAGSRGACV